MNWFLWTLVALFGLNAVATILSIGKPRTPISRGEAAILVVLQSATIAGIFLFGGQ